MTTNEEVPVLHEDVAAQSDTPEPVDDVLFEELPEFPMALVQGCGDPL